MSLLRRLLLRALSTAALTVAAVCASGAVAALGGVFSRRLDILTHLAPIWLAGAFAAAVLGLAAPAGAARRATFALALAGLLASGLLMAPEYLRPDPPAAPADAPRQIRLVQFNAWGGRNADVDGALAWLLKTHPDVIVMEEPSRALVAALRNAGGYHASCYTAHDRFCGSVVLSRAKPLSRGFEEAAGRRGRIPAARAVLPAPGGGTFTVMAAHLLWPTSARGQAWQRRRIGELLDPPGRRDRLILAGDFNSTPWSFARRADDRAWGLRRRTRALFSWPTPFAQLRGLGAPFPLLPIDHVYAGSAWRTVKVERGPAIGSDHYPVLVVLALAPQA
ncbi:endonuclease/exonuclease/phosphatase family protein [Phenylobacterium sp.]|uniref:endonuclease/exonuclease/phosphatase family protein n=1 Tax=Phenylobacterium sp. TaxID=1871053 RepID=UPI0035AED15D